MAEPELEVPRAEPDEAVAKGKRAGAPKARPGPPAKASAGAPARGTPAGGGATKPKRPPAAAKPAAAKRTSATRAAPKSTGGTGDRASAGAKQERGLEAVETAPEVIDLDKPPAGLPDLTFPRSPELEDSAAKAARRGRRLRIELIGGGILVLISVLTAVATGSPAILLLFLIVLAAVVAYELLVTSLE